jgi:hypothetical protein
LFDSRLLFAVGLKLGNMVGAAIGGGTGRYGSDEIIDESSSESTFKSPQHLAASSTTHTLGFE